MGRRISKCPRVYESLATLAKKTIEKKRESEKVFLFETIKGLYGDFWALFFAKIKGWFSFLDHIRNPVQASVYD
jgi:hypothetical protein